MEPILDFRSVSYSTNGRTILEDIDLSIAPGETLAVLGRSGSGKTTLLRMANALVTPTGGEVRFKGKPTTAWDRIQLRRSIGYVIQDVGLFPHFTVERNIALVPRLQKWTDTDTAERVKSLLELIGLPAHQYATRYPRELSGGQRQRVGVARALAADPPLMLLDEPFGALDPITRLDLQRQFIAIRDKTHKAAMFVTHDVREALAIGMRIALIKDGRIDTLATPDEFRKAQSTEARAFLAGLEP
jgi:osmoprotectant transport system ATP-binding protein